MRLFVVVLPQAQFARAKTWPNNLKLAVADTVTHGRYFHIRKDESISAHFNLLVIFLLCNCTQEASIPNFIISSKDLLDSTHGEIFSKSN